MKRFFAFAALCTLATPLMAQEFVFGLGYADFSNRRSKDGAYAYVEYHFRPVWHPGHVQIGFGAVGLLTRPGDYFIGIGPVVNMPIGSTPWFSELSVMPGYYNGTKKNDLGSDFEIRSRLALGYRFDNGWSLSGSISHMSNAGVGNHNPGVNTVALSVGHSF